VRDPPFMRNKVQRKKRQPSQVPKQVGHTRVTRQVLEGDLHKRRAGGASPVAGAERAAGIMGKQENPTGAWPNWEMAVRKKKKPNFPPLSFASGGGGRPEMGGDGSKKLG